MISHLAVLHWGAIKQEVTITGLKPGACARQSAGMGKAKQQTPRKTRPHQSRCK